MDRSPHNIGSDAADLTDLGAGAMVDADGWIVWFNGKIVPEREARVPFRDRGFK